MKIQTEQTNYLIGKVYCADMSIVIGRFTGMYKSWLPAVHISPYAKLIYIHSC